MHGKSLGLTFRYHDWEVETDAGTTVEDLSAFTLAPSYAVSENLLIIFEYRMDDDDLTNEKYRHIRAGSTHYLLSEPQL